LPFLECAPNQPAANGKSTIATFEAEPLIRHIVLFSAKNPADVEIIVAALGRLREIPDADHLEVVRNARLDQHSGEIDVIVYGEFADAEALARYKAHPIYHQTIGIVRPLRDLRIAVDYAAPITVCLP
jgi:Stress responsive A/B Barrel Domain